MTGEKDATAVMPGVEEIARAIYEQRNGYGAFAWSRRDAAHKQPYLMDARAVLALFAPKAEKPPTREDDAASSEIAVQSQPRIGAKRAAPILPPADELGQWKARALAAEAALAAERERCLAIVEAQVPEWVKQRSGPYWDGYREAMEDAADDIRKGAAAIRAQGDGNA